MESSLKVGDTVYQYQKRTWAYAPWFEEYKDCEYSEEYKKIISD